MREVAPGTKKPDAPLARCVGSRQEPAHRTSEKRPARHNDTMGLCWYFDSMSKGQIKLGGFYTSFAEITIEMNSETVLRWVRSRNPQTIYPQATKKSSLKQNLSHLFPVFSPTGASRCAYGTPVRDTGPVFSVLEQNAQESTISLVAFITPRLSACNARKEHPKRLTSDPMSCLSTFPAKIPSTFRISKPK